MRKGHAHPLTHLHILRNLTQLQNGQWSMELQTARSDLKLERRMVDIDDLMLNLHQSGII